VKIKGPAEQRPDEEEAGCEVEGKENTGNPTPPVLRETPKSKPHGPISNQTNSAQLPYKPSGFVTS
jgi:hypothetical protein